jgi:hypothetical protein
MFRSSVYQRPGGLHLCQFALGGVLIIAEACKQLLLLAFHPRAVEDLDELPLYRKDALEALRAPLEDGVVRIARSAGVIAFPCRFSLVGAMNPCSCGTWATPAARAAARATSSCSIAHGCRDRRWIASTIGL